MSVFYYVLPNGIKIVHKQKDSEVSFCGVMIGTGSKDENDDEHGITHLIEHTLFKGTKKRKAYHILSYMENIGGEINAYTTKEETCIHTSFYNNYYERSLELLSDILYNSTFPEVEIEKEKRVIIDEINSYRDTPMEIIYDEFEEKIFINNPIGRSVLGSEESLKNITREKIFKFIERNYPTDKTVISSVGNIKFEKLIKLVEKYFGNIPPKKTINSKPIIIDYKPFNLVKKKNTHQSHCIIGNIAYDVKHPDRYAMLLLNNILGGPGMNSRLNVLLREKNAFAYNIDSNYTAYTDTGIFTVYFGTDAKNIDRSIKLIKKEFEKFQEKPLTNFQLNKAKRQLIGQIAISSENSEHLMLTMAKSCLIYDKVFSMDEIKALIEKITPDQICRIANDVLNENKLSYLIYN